LAALSGADAEPTLAALARREVLELDQNVGEGYRFCLELLRLWMLRRFSGR
jgi:hypothetical protein